MDDVPDENPSDEESQAPPPAPPGPGYVPMASFLPPRSPEPDVEPEAAEDPEGPPPLSPWTWDEPTPAPPPAPPISPPAYQPPPAAAEPVVDPVPVAPPHSADPASLEPTGAQAPSSYSEISSPGFRTSTPSSSAASVTAPLPAPVLRPPAQDGEDRALATEPSPSAAPVEGSPEDVHSTQPEAYDLVGAGEPGRRPWPRSIKVAGRDVPIMVPGAAGLVIVVLVVVIILASSGGKLSSSAANQLVAAGLRAQLAHQTSEAVSDYSKAASGDPADAVAEYDLGTAYQDENNNSAALKAYQAAVQRDPQLGLAYYNLGILLSPTNVQAAIADYRLAIAASPTLASAHLNLGYLLRDIGDLESGNQEIALAKSMAASTTTTTTTP